MQIRAIHVCFGVANSNAAGLQVARLSFSTIAPDTNDLRALKTASDIF